MTADWCEWGCHKDLARVKAERDAARDALARVGVLADQWGTGRWPSGDGGFMYARRDYRVARDIRAAIAGADTTTNLTFGEPA